MTNGDAIKAMFPNVEVKEKNNGYEVYFGIGTAIQFFNHQWWNAPYKEIEQQPFINKPCISEGICHEDKMNVLNKIRAEIEQIADEERKYDEKWAIGLRYAVKIIDKYKAESEGRDEG